MNPQAVNLPNILSFIRILSVPVLIYLAWEGNEKSFFYLLIFAALTDALDGFIARTWNMKTQLGAKLDSTADFLLYIAAIYGIFSLKLDEFGSWSIFFYLLVFFMIFPDVYALIRFGKISSLHLYSWKIGAVLLTLFVFWLFYEGFELLLFVPVVLWMGLAFLENMIIQIMSPVPLTNAKSLYHFMKNKNHQ